MSRTRPEGLAGAWIRQLRAYGVRAACVSASQHLNARWQLRKATSVGSVRLDGRARVVNRGTMVIGDRVRLDGTNVCLDLRASRGGQLTIGTGTFINYGCSIAAIESVTIGEDCAIGQYAIIMDCDHHAIGNLRERGPVEPVVIEDGVWIGARSIVLRGTHIGKGSVIAANSVVRGTIPPYSVAAGSPARVIREIDEDDRASD